MLRALDLGGGERSLDRKPELRSPSTAPSLRDHSAERERSAERRDTGTSLALTHEYVDWTTATLPTYRQSLGLPTAPFSLVEFRFVVNSLHSARMTTPQLLARRRFALDARHHRRQVTIGSRSRQCTFDVSNLVYVRS